jgi:cytochrome P450
VHGCVGRTLATMEAQALLGAIVAQVDSIELAGRTSRG